MRILEESGQLPLAYIAAASHGFDEEAARLREVRIRVFVNVCVCVSVFCVYGGGQVV